MLPPHPPPLLTDFLLTTEEEVRKVILSASDATCLLDILPTKLLKSCIGALLPPITTLLNLCLKESTFPTSFKNAVVTPLLKKSTLSQDDLSSYHPISNLSFLSKILESLICNRLLLHLNSFDSISPFSQLTDNFTRPKLHSFAFMTTVLLLWNESVCPQWYYLT